MTYQRNRKLIFKGLTKKERQKIIDKLKKAIQEAQKECDKSPCFYRGCELWGDCKTCNGWHKGCEARLPECLFKNKDGTWKRDEY